MSHAPTTWYVVADGGKARILTRDGASMTTISQFDASGHGDTTESNEADIRHIHAPKDPHGQVKALFARQVADRLNKAALANEVDAIILAAPGHILHDISQALNKPATAALGKSLSKDLTGTPDADLASHFD